MCPLQFVLPEHLDINEAVRNEVINRVTFELPLFEARSVSIFDGWKQLVLSVAAEELRRISAWRCPGGKIGAVLRSSGVIFSVLNLARGVEGGGTSKPGGNRYGPALLFG